MNREQRRKLERGDMTQAELADIVSQENKAVMWKIVHEMNVVTAMAMHDEVHFGRKRIERVLTKILDLHDSIERGYVTIESIEEALKDETGLVIK